MLLLAAVAGLRRAEVAGVRFADPVGDEQCSPAEKGGHHRIVPLHADLVRELQVERSLRRAGGHGSGWSGPFLSPDGCVFPSTFAPQPLTAPHVARIVWPGACRGGGRRTPCVTGSPLRLTPGTHDLRAVQELLGHSSPDTTARYVQVVS